MSTNKIQDYVIEDTESNVKKPRIIDPEKKELLDKFNFSLRDEALKEEDDVEIVTPEKLKEETDSLVDEELDNLGL